MHSSSGYVGSGSEEASFGKGRIVIVAGAPASGKGTQCKRLADEYGFVHLSTGDVFRDLSTRGTELGMRAREFMEKGCFVPDELVLSLIRDRLSQPDVQERGCLLDGFPRTADQASALLKLVRVDALLWLQAPEKVLIRRAADRRIDPETGNIYHLKYMEPPQEVLSRLVRRDRDDEYSFRQRLDVFRGQQRRVLPFFSGQIYKVDATLEPDEVSRCLRQTLERLFRNVDGGPDKASTALPSNSCAICFEEPATFLVVPCGHQCGCEECLTAVQQYSGRCPICRTPVQSIQRVFLCARGAEHDAGTVASTAMADVEEPRTIHADLNDKLDAHMAVLDEDEWPEDVDMEEHGDEDDGVTLVVTPRSDVDVEGGTTRVVVRANIPDATVRVPVDFVCVIDVSGSMGVPATYETSDGEKKDDGLSVLDIVKHAVKTVIKALREGDRLALVSFNQEAKQVLKLTCMDETGQNKALEALDSLEDEGQTNIWAGLLAAMESLKEGTGKNDPASSGRQRAVLLLTDGQPNVVPPRGHVREMRDYMDRSLGFSFQLNTFGFGYDLDSDLLLQLATEGNGTYAFIPDAVIVGTTFVNCVANVISTLSQCATVSLMPCDGVEFTDAVLGGFAENNESWGRSVRLGPLQYGQSRELVVPMRLSPGTRANDVASYLEVVLTYPKASGGLGRVFVDARSRTGCLDAVVAACRADVVSTGYEALSKALQNKGKQAGADVASLNRRLDTAIAEAAEAAAGEADGRLLALKADVDGRMTKAFQGKDRFNRWGKHYLRALMRSHQVQLCTNFMDPGLQIYGGSLFRSLREVGDKIFLSLPAPKKKIPSWAAAYTTPQTIAAARRRPRSPSPEMNTYYAGAGGGCFARSSKVERVGQFEDNGNDIEQVPLSRVRAGDLLRVADGGTARVRCVVEVTRSADKNLITLPQGLRITPRHPVRIDGVWRLPQDVKGALVSPCRDGSVLNIVLDRCHVLLVEGIECVTWGHGIEGDVVGHRFFGSGRVIGELSGFEGWQDGFVRVHGVLRESASSEVCGLCGLYGPSWPRAGQEDLEVRRYYQVSNI